MIGDYNIVNLNITNGLHNQAISSGKNYILLTSAPAAAKVTVRLNSNTADEIELKENQGIKASNVKNIYISCNPMDGEKIQIATSTSADDFEIITAPTIRDIEEIAKVTEIEGFSSALLQELDKIINPYIFTEKVNGHIGSTNSLSNDFNSEMQCDMVEITLIPPTGNYSYFHGFAFIEVDNIRLHSFGGTTMGSGYASSINSKTFIIDDIKGKRLTILSAGLGNNIGSFYIKKFNKKA